MSPWSAPLLGRRVDVYRQVTVVDAPARHWWQSDTTHGEWEYVASGEIVDRAPNQPEYLVAHDDGRLEWHWDSCLRVARERA